MKRTLRFGLSVAATAAAEKARASKRQSERMREAFGFMFVKLTLNHPQPLRQIKPKPACDSAVLVSKIKVTYARTVKRLRSGKFIVGLISGTSADGIDAVVAKISGSGNLRDDRV